MLMQWVVRDSKQKVLPRARDLGAWALPCPAHLTYLVCPGQTALPFSKQITKILLVFVYSRLPPACALPDCQQHLEMGLKIHQENRSI